MIDLKFMEGEDYLTATVFKTRPALTDVTNHPTKRSFSSIAGAGDDSDLQPQKKICLGEENFVAKKDQLKFDEADTNHKDKGKNPCVSNVLDESKLLTENPSVFGEKNQDRLDCGVSMGNHGVQNNEREFRVADDLPMAVESSMPTISVSHDSKFVGLERCSALKGIADANSAIASEDLIKNCTCSFCSKAAYIWSDLYYQDVKGRLTTLRKSQKEANLLVRKFSGGKEPITSDEQNTSESSKLESTLMDQWKSLFVHMENTFSQEISQLESSCVTIKNLRDNCKTDLESSDNSHSDNH
ncbi:unnamed protein product [Lupinus luteus]|uniref:DNA-directed RNA polymerase n=1 Tax=Lupinus luteus TaxID=3873 RepID=A0AAV1Y8U3_LUPLU